MDIYKNGELRNGSYWSILSHDGGALQVWYDDGLGDSYSRERRENRTLFERFEDAERVLRSLPRAYAPEQHYICESVVEISLRDAHV